LAVDTRPATTTGRYPVDKRWRDPDKQTMRYDALIVGGSYAGLSAALQIAQARRSVLVIDLGRPRNTSAAASHGVFALDGQSGAAILTSAREQLASYATTKLVSGEAIKIHRKPNGFTVDLISGDSFDGRRVLLATGVADILPTLPGLAERWGRTVLHCPYCHGYEFAGTNIGVVMTGSMSPHQSLLLADWGKITFFTDGKFTPDPNMRNMMSRRIVKIEAAALVGLEGTAPHLDGVRLQDGRLVPVSALFISTSTRMASPLAEALGCAMENGPTGQLVRSNPSKQTSVPGVFVAGDAARMPHNIAAATADGVIAGQQLHHSLIEEEIASFGPAAVRR